MIAIYDSNIEGQVRLVVDNLVGWVFAEVDFATPFRVTYS